MVEEPALAHIHVHSYARPILKSMCARAFAPPFDPCVLLRSVILLMYMAERKHRAHNGGHVLSGDEQLMQPGPFSSNINGMEKYTRTEASSTAKLERLGERAVGRKCSECV